jgi:AbrB family looped-hinge helix DNA binding protein
MQIVKTHAKGQIVIPKDMREALGIGPGKSVSVKLVDDHLELRPLPDDPIEYLTGFFKGYPTSMASELVAEREGDDRIDEKVRI